MYPLTRLSFDELQTPNFMRCWPATSPMAPSVLR